MLQTLSALLTTPRAMCIIGAMSRKFFYLIDGLDAVRGGRLKRALSNASGVSSVSIRPNHGVVEIEASADPESQVRMACSIVGTRFRVRLKRRELY